MTDEERKMLSDLHSFLMKPTGPGKPSRAEQLDDALGSIRAGKLVARFALWISGAIIAITAAYNSFWDGR